MDVQAYLDRIGFEGAHCPSAEDLGRVIRCHLETVPFENLDFAHHPREMSLKIEDLYDKVVTRRRGGVCFELNGLMYWLLGQLGYSRYPVSVRIYLRPDGSAPITHQGNVAVVDGKRYYCDVGFGGPGPKGILCLDEAGEQIIDGEPFRVEWDGVICRILRQDEGCWNLILSFADVASDPLDFEFLLYYFTVNPNSHFATQRIVNLCRSDGSLALTENTFTRRKNGQLTRLELTSEAEVARVLKEEFGLVL